METTRKSVDKINQLMGALFHLLEASPDVSTTPPTLPAFILEKIVEQKLQNVAAGISEKQWAFLEEQCTVSNSEVRGWDMPERKKEALAYYYMSGLRQVFGAAASDYQNEIKPMASIMGDMYVTALAQIYAYVDMATRNYALITGDSIEELRFRGRDKYDQYEALVYNAEPSFLKAAMREQSFEYMNSFFHMFVLSEIKNNVEGVMIDLDLDKERFSKIVESTKEQLESGDMPGMEALKPIDEKDWRKTISPATPVESNIVWAWPFGKKRQVS
ncbi:MAG TPA: hypothetical protein DHW10_00900 [Rhodospirillaceae bacterium]|nr:hypothetical protein [Rhodospirillaceae bacterium]